MRKFEVLKTYAELAWAGYKEFKTKDATGAQIGAFDKRFEKVENSPANSSSGFQATLFKDKSTGEYILSVRGTEANIFNDPLEAFKDTIVADGNLALNDMPSSQTRDMMNFIFQLKEGKLKDNNKFTIKISTEDNITIVGHSLGGTLAQIASKMYPSLFDNCYTFNSPSGKNLNYHKIYKDSDGKYYWLGNEQVNFKHYVDDVIGQAFYNYQNSPMTTSVTDIRAKDFISPIANLYGGDRFGELIEVSGESHSITALTKILYFYDSMVKNGAGEEAVTDYLSGSYKSSSTLFKGGVANIAEQTMQKIDKIINKAINKTDIIDICQAYEDSTNNINFNIQLINPDSTIPNSNSSIENLYALINLNPFIVSGVDYSAYKELEKHKDEYSDEYIKDKAKMLSKALISSSVTGEYYKDHQSSIELKPMFDESGQITDSPNNQFIFGTNENDTIQNIKSALNKNTHTKIYALAGDDNITIIGGSAYIEAGSGSDTIDLRNSKGNNIIYADSKNSSDGKDDGDDTIYGGEGVDTIYGGEGVDTIYGGKGNDTYYVGDKDIIFDSDAKGSVIFEGVTLKGGVYDKDKGVYIDDTDNSITYRLNGDDKATLIVQKEGKSLTINNYTKSSKDLGINLVSSAVSVLVSDSSAVEANQKMNFNISLDRKLEEKEYLVLKVNDKKFLFGTLPNDSNINQGSFDDDNIIEFDKAS